ncbi:hypothetical protein [Priestia endophytica]|uniref:hypothetical protein n=1 Tax=Priestia endophytica TaxID=135735 RepID=UPI00178C2927
MNLIYYLRKEISNKNKKYPRGIILSPKGAKLLVQEIEEKHKTIVIQRVWAFLFLITRFM